MDSTKEGRLVCSDEVLRRGDLEIKQYNPNAVIPF